MMRTLVAVMCNFLLVCFGHVRVDDNPMHADMSVCPGKRSWAATDLWECIMIILSTGAKLRTMDLLMWRVGFTSFGLAVSIHCGFWLQSQLKTQPQLMHGVLLMWSCVLQKIGLKYGVLGILLPKASWELSLWSATMRPDWIFGKHGGMLMEGMSSWRYHHPIHLLLLPRRQRLMLLSNLLSQVCLQRCCLGEKPIPISCLLLHHLSLLLQMLPCLLLLVLLRLLFTRAWAEMQRVVLQGGSLKCVLWLLQSRWVWLREVNTCLTSF